MYADTYSGKVIYIFFDVRIQSQIGTNEIDEDEMLQHFYLYLLHNRFPYSNDHLGTNQR